MEEEKEHEGNHAAQKEDCKQERASFWRHICLLDGGPHADNCENEDDGDKYVAPDDEGPAGVFERDVRVAGAEEDNGNAPVVQELCDFRYIFVTYVAQVASRRHA